MWKRNHRHIDVESRHITRADGNAFLDLGLPPAEAETLKAASDRKIAEQLALIGNINGETVVLEPERPSPAD